MSKPSITNVYTVTLQLKGVTTVDVVDAKSEDEAREKILRKHPGCEVLSIEFQRRRISP